MKLIDTHAHLYLKEFGHDLSEVISDAKKNGIDRIILPNIDQNTIPDMIAICRAYPDTCFPCIGLHPTSVKDGFEQEMEIIQQAIENHEFVAIGECGIDLYWDKRFFEHQKTAFVQQIKWSKKQDLPLIIHARESNEEILEIIRKWAPLKGVFHCFSGTEKQAAEVIEMGFYIGIGGVATYKNSLLRKIARNIPLSAIVLETDAPYLAPVPFRGKRNESKNIRVIAENLAELLQIPIDEIAETTTKNALNLFWKNGT